MSYADLVGPYAVVITNGVKTGNGSASEIWRLIDTLGLQLYQYPEV